MNNMKMLKQHLILPQLSMLTKNKLDTCTCMDIWSISLITVYREDKEKCKIFCITYGPKRLPGSSQAPSFLSDLTCNQSNVNQRHSLS